MAPLKNLTNFKFRLLLSRNGMIGTLGEVRFYKHPFEFGPTLNTTIVCIKIKQFGPWFLLYASKRKRFHDKSKGISRYFSNQIPLC